jgi:small GTP-binding protein
MVKEIQVKRKICLIGDGGVGKTSLIRRFVLDQFDDKYLATFGTKVTKKNVEIQKNNDEMVNLYLLIWDVMGQEQFKGAQAHAYKGANGALIVCDVTRRDTFLNIHSWCQDLFNITNKVPIIILANKWDLHDNAAVNESDLEKMANEMNASYVLTSAKTGQNVDEAFDRIGKKLINE